MSQTSMHCVAEMSAEVSMPDSHHSRHESESESEYFIDSQGEIAFVTGAPYKVQIIIRLISRQKMHKMSR